MKQIALAVVLFLATLGGALWMLGVFHGPEPSTTPEREPQAPDPAVPTTPELSTAEPREQPRPEVPEVSVPIRVLMLGETSRSFPEWLIQTWDHAPKVSWQAWYGAPASQGTHTHSETLPALDKVPLGPDLESVQVLVLAGVDPARLGAEFWARVAERVKAGSLGLLVLPEFAFLKAIATEPSLASILPVTGVRPVAPSTSGGRDLAGVFPVARSFAVTEAGTHHPVSRLVPYPGWSAKLWAATVRDAGAWSTKFCPVVGAPAAGAEVLVQLDTGETKIPAVVASGPTVGRVLWVGGFFDLMLPAYTDPLSVERFTALSLSWLLWLASARS